MRARPQIPPTVPPAIAPAWEFEWCDEDEVAVEAVALVVELEEAGVELLVKVDRGGGTLGMRVLTASVCEMCNLHQ